MKIDDMNRQCGEEAKCTEHLFFHCGKSKLICKLPPVSWEGLQAWTNSFKE